ncbi:MAG: hypothetical protein DRP12_03575 [Candidatus Aenigmatarchaeota archaeon]|nr:MAG: hypothetical protein DRP12_03575 [Candidatus Aenigmarchaeota archaeon]
MEKKLHLIGTVHADPEGDKRLMLALVEHSPDYITLESNSGTSAQAPPEAIVSICELAKDYGGSDKMIENIMEVLLARGFEKRIAYMYQETIRQKKNVEVYEIDLPETDKFKGRDKIITKKFFEELPPEDTLFYSLMQDKELTLAERLIEDGYPLKLSAFLSGVLIQASLSKEGRERFIRAEYNLIHEILPSDEALARDEYMEKRIRDVYERAEPGSTIVHIGGMSHIFDRYLGAPNLYERLSDLKPTRSKLIDYPVLNFSATK